MNMVVEHINDLPYPFGRDYPYLQERHYRLLNLLNSRIGWVMEKTLPNCCLVQKLGNLGSPPVASPGKGAGRERAKAPTPDSNYLFTADSTQEMK